MGLFARIKRAFKTNVNNLLDKTEDPQKMLNQVILEMNQQLMDAKKSVAAAIADEKRLERQMKQQLTLADEWEQKAILAVKAGEDDLAKEALLRKQEYDNIAKQYKEQWQAQHTSVEQLKQSLRQLQHKIEEAQRKKNIIIARANRVETQKKIQTTMTGLSDNSAFQAFDRMNEKVERMETEVEAMKELDDMQINEMSLEEKFKQLEGGASTADTMLEDLKRKVNLLEDKSE